MKKVRIARKNKSLTIQAWQYQKFGFKVTQIRDHSKLAPFGGIFENSTFSESLSFVSILDEFKGVTVSFLLLEKKAKAFFYRIEFQKTGLIL